MQTLFDVYMMCHIYQFCLFDEKRKTHFALTKILRNLLFIGEVVVLF